MRRWLSCASVIRTWGDLPWRSDGGALPNFNIAVAVTDVFTEAMRKEDEYPLCNPRAEGIPRSSKRRPTRSSPK